MADKEGLDNARITPAHAGKTLQAYERDINKKDHPRACGENISPHSLSTTSPGSPPRMRGKQGQARRPRDRRGITPAHAGKTVFVDNGRHYIRDHPRACGENEQEIR